MFLDGMDEVDQKIVQLLIKNARMSYSDIGQQVGISRVAVKSRIKALEEKGVIEEYTAIINPPVSYTHLDVYKRQMMEIAALSFLGLGAKPPVAEWGSMMSDGRSMLQTYPWVVLTPGLAVFVSVTVFNLLGDAVRDALDPRGITRM